MSNAVTRHRAEQTFAGEFDRAAAKLPGGRAVADFRRRAWADFAAHGLPHRRIEEWKYTDLRSAIADALPLSLVDDTNVSGRDLAAALGPLAALDAHRIVLVNGHHRPELSRIDAAAGLSVSSLASALRTLDENAAPAGLLDRAGPAGDALAALNSAFATDGCLVTVAAGARLAKPILIVHVEAGPEPRFNAVHHAVRAMAGSRATIIEAYVALAGAVTGQVSTGASVTVDDGAALAHVKVACRAATHLATSVVGIGEGATYRAFQFTAGSELVRNQMFVTFSGAAARLDISGAMLGRGREHIDTTLVIDHATHGCESRELFKSVLDDRARAVFQGKVIVRRQAQKTDGKQMAQALMLSEDAEFDSKPELEIYADDVACGHGSTSAEIDPALMFYLRSRGIPKPQARAMLIESFIGEAIDKVEDEAVREALAAMARVWLAGH